MADQQQKTTYTAAEVAVLEETIRKQKTEIAELKRRLEHMNEVFANAQRARFGQSSEKETYVLGKDQLSLFDEAESAQDHKAEEPKPDTIFVAGHERKKKRTQAQMLNHLPEEEVLLEIPEEQRICSKCGGNMKPIGKKFLRHEMQIIPKQVRLLAYYAVTYACDKCEKDTGFARIVSVKPPVPLMKHSLASASTVAYIMAQKYVDGLPLARQEKIWEREGISLSRATMANWVIQCSQTWLKPLYKHMKQRLLEQSVIHADETVVQVLKEDGKPAASESRMWLYASDVAVRQRCASAAPGSALRIPAGPQRQAGRDLSQGVHRLPGDRWVCGIQPGAERNPLRLLEPRQAKMAGGHAGGGHGKDQQSRSGIPILQ